MVLGSKSHGIRSAVIGYLAAIALGYALGRTHWHILVQYVRPEDRKKAKIKKMARGGETMKRDKDECGDNTVMKKNPIQQVRKEKWWCVF